ncbi:hypothetical protein [Rheinheimera maricola]|uniref:DUF2846 domain-containing protein n=1 Tax=Rheinheimera maricola TaxID=2793282 RepID=A0ABS7XA11_9GAMM|nr:hypothetical protein [Rheinheimera maricola]MBZ9612014.1 hypothetical protein [Rheinheimera maricola]
MPTLKGKCRYLVRAVLYTSLWLPLACQAQFDIEGAAQMTLSNGNTEQLNYGFRYFRQDGNYHFVAGQQRIVVPSVPQKYSLTLILNDKNQVWVPDFSKEPLQYFTLSIAGADIVLSHEPSTDSPGHFVLQYNGEIYYFSRGPGQVNFYFTEEGISEIKIAGMLKPHK